MSRRSSLLRVNVDGELFVVLCAPTTSRPVASEWTELTHAEREVATLVIDGLGNAAIAARREVSARTIANQIASIFRKTGAQSRVELVARLVGRGGPSRERPRR